MSRKPLHCEPIEPLIKRNFIYYIKLYNINTVDNVRGSIVLLINQSYPRNKKYVNTHSQIAKTRYNKFMTLEEKIIALLIAQHKTIATAESCTGGLLSSRLTDVSGSSKAFLSGTITYSDNSKRIFLQVPAVLIQNNGAVSEPVATAMAKNVREIHRADFGVGITGIAGPTGGTKTKPLGLVYIAVATAQEAVCLKCQFKGTRKQIKSQAATQALKLLKEFLE